MSVQTSLDNFSAELNNGFSKDLFEFFEKHLGVKDNRGYVSVLFVVYLFLQTD